MQEVSENPVSLSLGSWFPPLLPTSPFEVAGASSLPSLTQHQSLQAASGVCVLGGRGDRAGVQWGPTSKIREPSCSGAPPVWTQTEVESPPGPSAPGSPGLKKAFLKNPFLEMSSRPGSMDVAGST